MKKLLICPSERPAVALLGQQAPLVTIPLLGQNLLEYWMSHLAQTGTKKVTILAHDHPEEVQFVAGDGARWGVEAKVMPESRELSPAQALLKYAAALEPAPPAEAIAVLDHFPGFPALNLFGSYAELFAALQQWMPHAVAPDRVGMRQVRPGVWLGSHSVISPASSLREPCWIGRHVFIGPGVVLGPNTIIEDGAYIEAQSELVQSWIGPDTFVGKFSQIANSLARGNTLINWQTGSLIQVPDPFLLCALRRPRERRTAGWFARLTDLYARNKAEAHVLWKHLLLNKES